MSSIDEEPYLNRHKRDDQRRDISKHVETVGHKSHRICVVTAENLHKEERHRQRYNLQNLIIKSHFDKCRNIILTHSNLHFFPPNLLPIVKLKFKLDAIRFPTIKKKSYIIII